MAAGGTGDAARGKFRSLAQAAASRDGMDLGDGVGLVEGQRSAGDGAAGDGAAGNNLRGSILIGDSLDSESESEASDR